MPDSAGGRARTEPPLRAAVVGVSGSRACGVRDHSVLLAGALERHGIACSLHWLWRDQRSLRGARAEVRAWTRGLADELDRSGAGAVLFAYSVFAYAYRGLPVFVPATLSALRASGLPVIAVMHEFAYPWRLGGARGKAWALTQRAALIDAMRASSAVIVTAPFRGDYLSSRPWLPRRPIALAPVYSNLPAPSVERASGDDEQAGSDRRVYVIGLFGYAYQGAASSLVLDALSLVRNRDLEVRLRLLGAPGRDSPAAEAWLAGARARGFEDQLSFSGVLAAQDLSDALACCDVLLHPEPAGPTSRKGTLAGSLASGSAVVAIDGPRRWSELIESEAALVVAPKARAVADAIAELLDDAHVRGALGARGRTFAKTAMGVDRSATVAAALLEAAVGRRPSGAVPAGLQTDWFSGSWARSPERASRARLRPRRRR